MSGFTSMVDLARTPDEVKKEIGKDMPSASPIGERTVPTYPYGLCVSLDEETLKKMKLDGDLPDVGEMIHFCAMAKVTSASMSEREGTDGAKETCRRVELQITHLGLESEDAENRNWYGDSMKSEPDAKAA
jgi:hypothetical protein